LLAEGSADAANAAEAEAAEEFTELLEQDHYQDMPILPTSAEMIGQCAFELQENMRTFEKCEDYIQTHFMLLREDYIEPLQKSAFVDVAANGRPFWPSAHWALKLVKGMRTGTKLSPAGTENFAL